jgi:hypothetical protein
LETSAQPTEPPESVEAAEEPLPSTPDVERITVETDPPGAEIFAGGILVGNAPVSLPRPTEAMEIEARLRGHEPATAQLSADSPDAVSLTLTTAAAARARASMHRRHPTMMAVAAAEEPEEETPEPVMEPTPMMRRNDGLGLLTPSSWND